MRPLFLWCEIVCAECSTTTGGHFTRTAPARRELWAEAKRKGWVRTEVDVYCSANCRDQAEARG